MIKITNIKIYLLKYNNKNPVLSSFGNIKFRSSLVIEIHDENFKESKTYKFLDSCNYELIWSGVFSFIFKSR